MFRASLASLTDRKATGKSSKRPTRPAPLRLEGLEERATPAGISGRVFYDGNVTGVLDGRDRGLANWQVILDLDSSGGISGGDSVTNTNAAGFYSFDGLAPGTYQVCQTLDSLPGNWVQTTATCIGGIILGPDSTDNNFGDARFGAGTGGQTIGFWRNPNGKAVLEANDPLWRNVINDLNLRNADGSHFDVSLSDSFEDAFADWKEWLQGANAVNMAYMLSAQLAVTQLNVCFCGLVARSIVYAPGCGNIGYQNNFIRVSDLITSANTELGLHGDTPAGSPHREFQACLKDALDGINNNINFILPALHGPIVP
jgi:hypothetical protein